MNATQPPPVGEQPQWGSQGEHHSAALHNLATSPSSSGADHLNAAKGSKGALVVSLDRRSARYNSAAVSNGVALRADADHLIPHRDLAISAAGVAKDLSHVPCKFFRGER